MIRKKRGLPAETWSKHWFLRRKDQTECAQELKTVPLCLNVKLGFHPTTEKCRARLFHILVTAAAAATNKCTTGFTDSGGKEPQTSIPHQAGPLSLLSLTARTAPSNFPLHFIPPSLPLPFFPLSFSNSSSCRALSLSPSPAHNASLSPTVCLPAHHPDSPIRLEPPRGQ